MRSVEPTIKPAPNVHSRVVGKELVLLDFARGEYFALDEVGAGVWSIIEKGATVSEIAGVLSARYDVEESVARQDSQALIDQLRARRLVVFE